MDVCKVHRWKKKMQKQEYVDAVCKGAKVHESEINLWNLPGVSMKGYGNAVPSTPSSVRITSTDYTRKNADAAIAHLVSVRDGQRIALKQYWKSHEGKTEKARLDAEAARKAETLRILTLAESAGILRGNHGSDYHAVYVDGTSTPQDQTDYQTHGPVYLIRDERERTYSKAYTRNFGTGKREDQYLLGTNEGTGTAWVRAVPICDTVRDALKWAWGVDALLYRQGDVALTECDHQPKTGWAAGSVEVARSHVVTGEIARRGSVVYARKAELVHAKNQHATIAFSDCRRVVVARTYEKPRSRTSSD